MRFEANRGQTDSRVQYLARGAGYTLFLTGSAEAVFTLNRAPTTPRISTLSGVSREGPPPVPARVTQDILRLRFEGANATPRVLTENELPERSNYFQGASTNWKTDIANFGKVVYQDLYPGIDVAYYGNQQQLEYDLIVKPGANPNAVRLAFTGASQVSVNPQGGLVLQTVGGGSVVQQAPVLYQETNGQRQAVTGRYVLQEGNRVSFEVGSYDVTRPLVIDPVVNYGTYLGGSGDDQANAVAVDPSNNAYLVGTTASSNFPLEGPLYTQLSGPSDVFVTKLDPTGKTALFSTYLGGTGDEIGQALKVDLSGNIFLTGRTTSTTTFPVTTGAFQTTFGGGSSDAFIVRLTPTGDVLQYGSYYGTSQADEGLGIDVDVDSVAYVTGYVTDPTIVFPQVFAIKVAEDGTNLLYNKILGGDYDDVGRAIVVSPSGHAFIVGNTENSNFPGITGGWDSTRSGQYDAFVLRLDPFGNIVQSTFLGGNVDESATGVALDSLGNVCLTGLTTSSTGFPTNGGTQTTFGGGASDAFLTKFTPNLTTAPTFSTYYGGSGLDFACGIGVDADSNVTVAGSTTSTNLTTANPIQSSNGGGASDAFVAQWNSTGTTLLLGSYLGGSSADEARGVAWDFDGAIYLAGFTNSTNLPTLRPFQGSLVGGKDAFLSKIGKVPAPPGISNIEEDNGGATNDTITNQQTVRVYGYGDPNSTVRVNLDNYGQVAEATADSYGGYSYAYPSLSLSPNSSTTFSVRLDATACKSSQGNISFTTNDTDEGTFDIPVTGTVTTPDTVQYNEDENVNVVLQGSWYETLDSACNGGDYYMDSASTTGDKAILTYSVKPGKYKVWLSWKEGATCANNTPVSVYNGNCLVKKVELNQQSAPNDLQRGNVWYEQLGGSTQTFQIGSNAMMITVGESASGRVAVDCVRIERVGDLDAAEIEVVDPENHDLLDGVTTPVTTVSYGTTPKDIAVLKTFTVRNQGGATLTLYGFDPMPSGFTLVSYWSNPTDLAPGASTTFSVRLDAGTPGSYSGEIKFATSDADENPFNFTVAGTVGSGEAVQTIDDGDTAWSESGGSWTVVTTAGYGTDYRWLASGTGSNTGTWAFTVTPGRYKISATWVQSGDRATNAPFTILDNTTTVATVNVNQQNAPSGMTYGGSVFQELTSSVTITSTTLNVKLSDNANGKVVADAIRIEYVGGVPDPNAEIQVLEGSSDLADGTTVVNFGETPMGVPVTKTFTIKNTGTSNLILTAPISVPVGFSLLTSFAGVALPEGRHTFTATTTVSGQTSEPSAPHLFVVDRTPPEVTLNVPTTTDFSPEVRVTVFDLYDLPNDTTSNDYKVHLDVDLDGDGAFSGNEIDYTVAVLHDDHAIFEIRPTGSQPALGVGTYNVRARVRDQAGNEGCSKPQSITITSLTSWSLTAQHINWDPYDGMAMEVAGDVTISHPFEVGMDAACGACSCGGAGTALVYHSTQSNTLPVIQATLQAANNATLPTSVTFTLNWDLDGVNSSHDFVYNTTGRSKGEAFTASLQLPSAVNQTGRYRYTVSVAATGVTVSPVTSSAFLVSRHSSSIAPGWAFSMIDQLVEVSTQGSEPAGMYRIFGSGGWRFYSGPDGNGVYTSPGNDRGTLKRIGASAPYTYTYTDTTGNQWRFNSDKRQDQYTSADGTEVTAFEYNGDGTLSEMTTPCGCENTFSYTSGMLTSITAPGGRVTTTGYNSGTGNFQISDPASGLRDFYYTSSRITEEYYGHHRRNWSYTNGLVSAYSEGGGMQEVTVSSAAAQGLSSLVAGPARAVSTDDLDHATRYTFDSRGRPLTQIAADGGLTSWTRDGDSFVSSMTDPFNRTTSYTRHSVTKDVTQETLPDGSLRQTYIDNKNSKNETMPGYRVITSTDERGNVTTYDYDDKGRQISTLDALGQLSTQAYHSTTGLLEQQTDRRGVTSTHHYDHLRRQDAMTEGLAPLDAGTSTSNSNTSTTLADSTRNWTTDGWKGLYVVITGGKGVGQRRKIASNTATTLTIESTPTWTTDLIPDSTSTYALVAWTGTASNSSTSTTLQHDGTSPSWTTNGWNGKAVFITGGTGAGQRRVISSNTANTLTLSMSWGITPDSTSTYAIVSATATEYRLTQYFYNAQGHQEVVVSGQSPFHPHITVSQSVVDHLGRTTQSVAASNVYQTGTSSGGNSTTTLKDISHRWGKDIWAGKTVVIVSGTGSGQSRVILSNTADTLTISGSSQWTTTPDATSKYEITLQSGTATGATNGTTVTLSDSSRSWSADQWTGLAVLITGGTGAGQFRLITSNTSTQLSLANPWATTPTTSSTYAIVPAERQVSTTEYGDPGNVELVTDHLGRKTRYLYDAANRVTEVREAEGMLQQRSSRTSYDVAGNVSQSWDALNHISKVLKYDAHNRPVVSVSGFGSNVAATVTTVYNLVGNVVSSYDPLGRRSSDVQDIRDRSARMNEAVGSPEERFSTTSYDVAGNVVATTTGLGAVNPFVVTTRSVYDQLNRRTVTLEAANALVYGTSTGGNDNTKLLDTSKTWTTDQWAKRAVRITSGTGAGQTRQITGNSVSQLNISPNWGVPPDITSTYEILHQTGTATSAGDTTLTDTSKNWTGIDWSNKALVIVSGKGAGQYRQISSNTSTQLTVSEKWTITPNSTSAYEIMDPLRVSTTTYDPEGNVLTSTTGIAQTNPFVVTSRSTYDALGRTIASATAANVHDNGITVDGNGSTTLKDPNKSWTADQWNGKAVLITAGKGTGQSRLIADTETSPMQLIVATPWDTSQVPDHTSRYEIVPAERHESVTVYDAASQVLRSTSGYGGDPARNHLVTSASSYDMLGRSTHTVEAVVTGGQSSGTNTSTTLNDSTQNWGTDTWKRMWLFITGGTGRGQVLQITSNTSTQLTVNGSWNPVPDATSTYAILESEHLHTGAATAPFSDNTKLNDGTQKWITNSWAGRWVRITSGPGSGQVREISSNTETQLTLATAWSTSLTADSTYAVLGDGKRVSSVTFDTLGNVSETTNALGHKTAFTYDAVNRTRTTTLTANVYATGTATSGSGTTVVQLNQTWRTNEWQNKQVRITAGPGSGQIRTIASNTADTLTISGSAFSPAPGATLQFEIVLASGTASSGAYSTLTHTSQGWTSNQWAGRLVRITSGTGVGQERIIQSNTSDTLTVGTPWNTPAPDNTSGYEIVVIERRTTRTAYDPNNTGTAVTDAALQTSRTGQDGRDRTIKSIDARLAVQKSLLNVAGEQRATTDPVGNKWTYEIDNLGRVVEEINSLDKSRLFTYDAAGHLITQTDRRGLKREFAFDLLDRNTTETWKDGSTTVRTMAFTFDAGNNMLSVSDNDQTSTNMDTAYAHTYDLQGRALTVSNTGTTGAPTVVLTAGYLADSLRSSLSATVGTSPANPDFSNTYQYDSVGRLTQVQQESQSGQSNVAFKRVTLAYNPLDQFTIINRYKKIDSYPITFVVESKHTYDPTDRIQALAHRTTSSSRDYSFVWDNNERLTNFYFAPDGTSTYQYDRSNQLVKADHTYQDDEDYSYDDNGNRTDPGFVTQAENRMQTAVIPNTPTDDTYTYTFDDEGNRLTRSKTGTSEVTTYDWDHRNRLTHVLTTGLPMSATVEAWYNYDTADRRLRKRVLKTVTDASDKTTRFVYDGEHIALAFDTTGATQLKNRYLHGALIDQILADEQISSGSGPGTVYYPTTDHLGTVRDLLTDNGTLEEHLVYDSFGRITTDSSTSREELFAYTGRERDTETGLYYYRARYYDAGTHQFLSVDPVADDTNLYRYTRNDPTSTTDPMGLISVSAKSVPWPQTGYEEGTFHFFWGVALYIDESGLKELAEANSPGGYIVSKRTITQKAGDKSGTVVENSSTAWHLNQIKVEKGKLVPNHYFDVNKGNGLGGARLMEDGSTALTYFSVINKPESYSFYQGKVTVELSWKLYKCAPNDGTIAKFPKFGLDYKGVGSGLGWDEYAHTRWTSDDPKIEDKPLAEGKIDATITWKSPDEHMFTSSNKDIRSGPNRSGRQHRFRGWEYNDKEGKWVAR